jgi:hypothetical protein
LMLEFADVDVDEQDWKGNTPLHLLDALAPRHDVVFELFKATCADFHSLRNDEGVTFLTSSSAAKETLVNILDKADLGDRVVLLVIDKKYAQAEDSDRKCVMAAEGDGAADGMVCSSLRA